MHYITIKEFTEEESLFNVHVDDFDMSVITLFADLNKVFFTKLGTTFLTLGAEYYETRKIDIVFSNNPNSSRCHFANIWLDIPSNVGHPFNKYGFIL